jgi:hypothetical protein
LKWISFIWIEEAERSGRREVTWMPNNIRVDRRRRRRRKRRKEDTL